jgi:hypothetical protein
MSGQQLTALFSCFFSTHIASQNSSSHKIGATVKRRVAYAYLHQFLILLEQDKFEELVQK